MESHQDLNQTSAANIHQTQNQKVLDILDMTALDAMISQPSMACRNLSAVNVAWLVT
jgi:hypothetical protein